VLGGISKLMAKGGLWLGVGISVVLAIGSIALVAVVVVHWPADHFKPHLPGGRAVESHAQRPRRGDGLEPCYLQLSLHQARRVSSAL